MCKKYTNNSSSSSIRFFFYIFCHFFFGAQLHKTKICLKNMKKKFASCDWHFYKWTSLASGKRLHRKHLFLQFRAYEKSRPSKDCWIQGLCCFEDMPSRSLSILFNFKVVMRSNQMIFLPHAVIAYNDITHIQIGSM